MNKLDQIIQLALHRTQKIVAVACFDDFEVLCALKQAAKIGLCRFLLYGDQEKADSIFSQHPELMDEQYTIFDVVDKEEACRLAVRAVSSHQADVLMKGLVDTAIILKQVLNKEYGLRTDSILSHTMVIDLPKFDRLLFLSDGAMNIDPNPTQLMEITLNAIELAHSLEIKNPKVALISAIEKVNPKMPSSVKAHEVIQMFLGEDIRNCEILGPVALDIALDPQASSIKGITNPVGGHADILIMPYIEVGNALYKGWMFGTDGAFSAGIVLGASAPIVLTSRADSHASKLYSLALSVLLNS